MAVVSPQAMLLRLATERQQLQQEYVRARRAGDPPPLDLSNVLDYLQVLRAFGVPWVISPSEADAQCAWMDARGLVDGVATADSDVIVFGARTVYRHLLDANRTPACVSSDRMAGALGVAPARMVDLALLLGGDYTAGVGGVGPATAVEVLRNFDSLHVFKEWVDAGAPVTDADAPGKKKLSRSAKRFTFPPHFPERHVIEGYTRPIVEDGIVRMTWSRPDAGAARALLMHRCGMSRRQTDDLLTPALVRYRPDAK